jgi:hypothetical protein
MARMGGDAALTIRRVAAIPPEKSGKYRYVVSKVPSCPSSSGASHNGLARHSEKSLDEGS